MDKFSLKDRFKYWFDNMMARGTGALILVLFLITIVITIITALIGMAGNPETNVLNSIWIGFMHVIDPGTITGDETTGQTLYIVMMLLATLCGIFITSILIGIITTGFESKFKALRKGNSKVLEKNHTVILGFNEGIHTILSELILANEDRSRACIVVLGEEEKEDMEDSIKGHITNTQNTKIVCKSGKLTDYHVLDRCSLETCRSIIINIDNDFFVTKTILAVVNFLKSKDAFNNSAHITTMIRDVHNLSAAKIAGEGKAEILYFDDAISRIIAHTSRQPGLSGIFLELFSYRGSEIHYEEFKEFQGMMFGDILNLFEHSTAIGIDKGEDVYLKPPMNTIIEEGDKIIHLAKDGKISYPTDEKEFHDIADIEMPDFGYKKKENSNLLILGNNAMLGKILSEFDHYVATDTKVLIADEKIAEDILKGIRFKNIVPDFRCCDIYDRKELEGLLEADISNIILLSNEEIHVDEMDAKSLLLLIQLHDIARQQKREFNITSEMCAVENQKLASTTDANDFIVGSNVISLMLTQISENRLLVPMFEDLLDDEGAEIYMKEIQRYVKQGVAVNFHQITDICRTREEVAIGYRRHIVGKQGVETVLNPHKDAAITFQQGDCLIVISESNKERQSIVVD